MIDIQELNRRNVTLSRSWWGDSLGFTFAGVNVAESLEYFVVSYLNIRTWEDLVGQEDNNTKWGKYNSASTSGEERGTSSSSTIQDVGWISGPD